MSDLRETQDLLAEKCARIAELEAGNGLSVEQAIEMQRLRSRIAELEREIADLNADATQFREWATPQLERLGQENAKYEEALHRIAQWSDAYPLEVFPEPDFKRVNEVLKAAGISLDQVSASIIRHVVNGIGRIAKTVL